MFESNTFSGSEFRGEPANPYSPGRTPVESYGRQIERFTPAPEDIPVVETQREYSEPERVAMRSVKSGLQLYFSGIYLVTFCFFVSGFLGRAIGPQVATVVSYGTTLGVLIVLWGELKCLSIPKDTGGFKHVLLSVLFYSLGVILSAIKFMLQARGVAFPGMVVQIGILQLLVGFLANFFFLTFIICLTRFMENQKLYQKAVKTRRAIWSMVGFMFIVIFVVAIMLNQLPQNGRQLVFLVFGLGVLGFIILVYSWLNRFTRLVQETCNAIQVENQFNP